MDIVDYYLSSWTNDDRDGVRQVLAPDVEVEWNLNAPVDDEELVQALHRIAMFADAVTVVSRVRGNDGAVLIYELAAPFGTARLAEFVTITDGKISTIRQVYDLTAVDRYFPGLYEN